MITENLEISDAAIESHISEAAGWEEGFTTDSAIDALMEQWGAVEEEDGKRPSKSTNATAGEHQDGTSGTDEGAEGPAASEGETGEEDDSDIEENESSSGDGEGTEGEEAEEIVLDDDAIVTVKVDGEDKEFSLGSLKRLAGQEASLTRKGQEVAEMRKSYETNLGVQKAALEGMLDRAAARFAPYKDIDFNLAARQYEPEVYKALRDDAQSAYADMMYFKNELGGVMQTQAETAQRALEASAAEAVKALRDPNTGIPGFSREMFGKMQDFAVSQGISQDLIGTLVDPAAWKLINMAMQYSTASAVKAEGKPDPKRIKRVIKGTGSVTQSAKKRQSGTARQRAAHLAGGMHSIDAAVEAFMQSWGVAE